MAAKFVLVSNVLAASGLETPETRALIPDAHLADIIAIQPSGQVRATEDFVGHANAERASALFAGFFRMANGYQPDLAFSPEYSCPWPSLRAILERGTLPALGKLWIIGCEAITPNDLRETIRTHPDVVWIHEEIPASAKTFLDPVAYVFKTHDKAGEVKDVVLLQFKTQAMADHRAFERDHLIEGTTIYVWHNPLDNIRLITLICSEALTARPEQSGDCRFDLHPFVVFHPQLNSDPRHAAIRTYRRNIFSEEMGWSTDVFALNWAHGFLFEGNNESVSGYGASAIYTRSHHFNRTDNRINANHRLGMYYSRWQVHRADLCWLNFDEGVFRFRMPKVRLVGPAVLANRTGPEMRELHRWQEGAWQRTEDADDGFLAFRDAFGQPHCNYCTDLPNTPTDRERLFTLSSGCLVPEEGWHQVSKIDSFRAEDDERSKRFTFLQETAHASVTFRQHYLSLYVELHIAILPNENLFPPNIENLRNDWRIEPPKAHTDFRFNLFGNHDQAGATAIFVGIRPQGYAEQIRDQFIANWGRDKTRRLVVWYQTEGIVRYSVPPVPDYTEGSDHPAAINRDAPQT